jgi:hypothetical protein
MIHNSGSTADTAETAALAVEGPQPVWMTLNEARERAFTGEIVFETIPEVFAYLDNGVVYYAERAADVSLGRRLLDAGVVDIDQLERGTVRVGDIEHLGRLFDRDPSVDRDAVIVLAETATQELIAHLASQSIATVRFTAYRHHPSGVHRWFVAPLDPAAIARPLSAVAQLDTIVVDELPSLPFDAIDGGELLVIEWDEELDDAIVDDTVEVHASVFELSLELAEFTDGDPTDADTADADSAGAAPADIEPVDSAPAADDGAFEFSVVWPDGSEEPATEDTLYVQEPMASLDEPSDTASADALDAEIDAVLTEAEDHTLRFTMPPLELSDEPDRADADVPDDVAEAVRRAIAAIESASVPETGSAMQLGDLADVEVHDEPAIADRADVTAVTGSVPAVEASAGGPAGFGSFAPPTMAMRAEVMYAQMEADATSTEPAPDLGEAAPSGGVASVVFVDEDAGDDSDGGNDRSSALRRLIGSLRRKDH